MSILLVDTLTIQLNIPYLELNIPYLENNVYIEDCNKNCAFRRRAFILTKKPKSCLGISCPDENLVLDSSDGFDILVNGVTMS